MSLAFGVVIDDAIHNFPMAIVPLRNLPTGEIFAVEERSETVGFGCAESCECERGRKKK